MKTTKEIAADCGISQPMKTYRVRWEIDIEAETPEEAALRALIVQRNRDEANVATVFDVTESRLAQKFNPPGLWRHIDLGEITAEQAEARVNGLTTVRRHTKKEWDLASDWKREEWIAMGLEPEGM